MSLSNSIAVLANRSELDLQVLLAETAATWRNAGASVAGVLAERSDVESTCSAAFLRDIASGRRYSIQLDATPAGTSCHLDVAGIDDVCAGLLPQIPNADVVLLSKFGKTEATRQGLWPAFLHAAATGVPLLTTISEKHVEIWKSFAPEAAWLEPDSHSIQRWWHTVGEWRSRISGRREGRG